MGESDRSKQANKLYGEIGELNPTVNNRFNNLQDPFDFGKMSGQVEDTFGGYEDMINRDTAEQIATQQEGAASSMASRGITGGSVLTDTQSKIASDVNKGKSNAFSQLGIGKSKALGDLMEYFNQMNFAKTKAATDVDFGNIGNLFQKYGLKTGALGGLDDTTGWDDFMSILSVGGNLAEGIGSITSGGGGMAGGGR